MTRVLMDKKTKGAGSHGDKRGSNMVLISVTVLGSTGPIRNIVREGQLVSSVIQTTLKSYAREGRYPALGSDQDQFLLYCANGESGALSPSEVIGKSGGRNFLLCKKPKTETPATEPISITGKKGNFKAWLKKSFIHEVSSH
ncbi:hypothetical protein MLD38_017558 [Melastoma candidum]|uniref:Uncharacterized protein n=1 Tax=Melastoma candidum TaxID=119954 RepID=A0ACB9QZ85_9MYRT|nr:hypothetical protein MLD38_017558 [Melastoma candidum]